MRKGKVFNLKRFRLTNSLQTNGVFWLLLILLLLGLMIGTFTYSNNSPVEKTALQILKGHAKTHLNQRFISLVWHLFLSELLPILLFFISGTSMLGIVLAPIFLGYRGFRFGIIASFLYACYGIKGVAFYAVLLIPPAIPIAVCWLLSAKEALSLSGMLAKSTFPESSPTYFFPAFRNYCKKFLLFLIIILVAAIIDAALTGAFYQSFVPDF